MPRQTPVRELQKEEPIPNSPLRRSSRLSTSSPVPTKVVTRRNSATDNTTSTPKPTRSRRLSATQESVSVEEPEKKTTSSIRTRRGSVTKTNDPAPEEPVSKPRTRRSSTSKEPTTEVKTTTRGRRSVSVDPEPAATKEESQSSKAAEEAKKTTKRRRSVSTDVEQSEDDSSKKTTKRRSRSEKDEKTENTNDPHTKDVPVSTPLKKSPSSIEEDDSQKNKKRFGEITKMDLDLSVIDETSFTEEDSSLSKNAKDSTDVEKPSETVAKDEAQNVVSTDAKKESLPIKETEEVVDKETKDDVQNVATDAENEPAKVQNVAKNTQKESLPKAEVEVETKAKNDDQNVAEKETKEDVATDAENEPAKVQKGAMDTEKESSPKAELEEVETKAKNDTQDKSDLENVATDTQNEASPTAKEKHKVQNLAVEASSKVELLEDKVEAEAKYEPENVATSTEDKPDEVQSVTTDTQKESSPKAKLREEVEAKAEDEVENVTTAVIDSQTESTPKVQLLEENGIEAKVLFEEENCTPKTNDDFESNGSFSFSLNLSGLDSEQETSNKENVSPKKSVLNTKPAPEPMEVDDSVMEVSSPIKKKTLKSVGLDVEQTLRNATKIVDEMANFLENEVATRSPGKNKGKRTEVVVAVLTETKSENVIVNGFGTCVKKPLTGDKVNGNLNDILNVEAPKPNLENGKSDFEKKVEQEAEVDKQVENVVKNGTTDLEKEEPMICEEPILTEETDKEGATNLPPPVVNDSETNSEDFKQPEALKEIAPPEEEPTNNADTADVTDVLKEDISASDHKEINETAPLEKQEKEIIEEDSIDESIIIVDEDLDDDKSTSTAADSLKNMEDPKISEEKKLSPVKLEEETTVHSENVGAESEKQSNHDDSKGLLDLDESTKTSREQEEGDRSQSQIVISDDETTVPKDEKQETKTSVESECTINAQPEAKQTPQENNPSTCTVEIIDSDDEKDKEDTDIDVEGSVEESAPTENDNTGSIIGVKDEGLDGSFVLNKSRDSETDLNKSRGSESYISPSSNRTKEMQSKRTPQLNKTAELDSSLLTSSFRKRTSDRTSINLQETMKAGETPDDGLSDRIHKYVDLFCSGIKNSADVSINVSLEFVGQDADPEDENNKTNLIEVSLTAEEAKETDLEPRKGSKRRKICTRDELESIEKRIFSDENPLTDDENSSDFSSSTSERASSTQTSIKDGTQPEENSTVKAPAKVSFLVNEDKSELSDNQQSFSEKSTKGNITVPLTPFKSQIVDEDEESSTDSFDKTWHEEDEEVCSSVSEESTDDEISETDENEEYLLRKQDETSAVESTNDDVFLQEEKETDCVKTNKKHKTLRLSTYNVAEVLREAKSSTNDEEDPPKAKKIQKKLKGKSPIKPPKSKKKSTNMGFSEVKTSKDIFPQSSELGSSPEDNKDRKRRLIMSPTVSDWEEEPTVATDNPKKKTKGAKKVKVLGIKPSTGTTSGWDITLLSKK